MNKNELTKKVAEQNDLTVKAASAVVDSVLNTIMDTVAAGEEVQLFGFGRLRLFQREAS